MEKINVNAKVAMDYNLPEGEQGSQTSLRQGDIVEGIITDVSDMISITFNDKEVKVSQSAVQNAKEGQIRKFEIKDISNKSIVLREVGTNTERKTSGVLQTNVLTGGKAFSGYIREKVSENTISETEKVHSQMENVRNSLTIDDYINIKELDRSPEQSSSEEFEKNLERIKEQRQFTQTHLDKQIKRLNTKRETIQQAAISSASGNAKEIAKRLEDADLPVTSANIERVSTALEMASQAPKLTNEAKAYLIDNELYISPENIYKAAYSGSQTVDTGDATDMSEEQWKELEPKVQELVKKEGIPVNKQSMKDARWLLSMDLPVTGDTLTKLQVINSLQSDYQENQVLDFCIQGMKERQYPEKTDFIKASESLNNISKTVSTMDLLQQLTLEAAESVSLDETISLQKIYQYQNIATQDSEAIKNITARRQLEQVRQKMTMENCYRLYQQGIEVDTESLENVINQLKAMEDSYYSELYKMAGVIPNEQQIDLLSATDQVVNQIKTMPEAILAATYSIRSSITLRGLYEVGASEVSTNQTTALVDTKAVSHMASYETLMTAPRRDLGDSMKKAFASVDYLLQEIGMEPTDSNRQAVRILGYNGIEITNENVTQMKSYQLQVQRVVSALTPQATVSLIREGDNPLQIPLAQLSEKLATIKESKDTTSEEKFSEYLYKLDQKKSLAKEERDAYIGVYRLLYQVEKTDGAAVGAVVKANQELTLYNLLTAVRSKKKEGMDLVADEGFGGVEEVSSGTSITEQINKVYLGRQMTHQVYEELEPDLIDRTYNPDTMNDFMDLEIEQLYEESRQSDKETTSSYEDYKYHELMNNYGRAKEAALLVATSQTVHANNLEAAGLLMAEGSTLYKEINKQAQSLDEQLGNSILSNYESYEENLQESSVREAFHTLSGTLNQMFEIAMENDNVTEDQIQQIRRYQNCIRLAGNLTHQQTFEIPVVMGEDVVNLKVKLVEGQQEASTVKLQMSSEQFGTLDAVAVVREDMLQGYLICDNRQVVEQLTFNEGAMRQEMQALGLNTGELIITMNRKAKEFYRTDITEKSVGEKPSNQTLYQVAKIFIKYAKQATTL